MNTGLQSGDPKPKELSAALAALTLPEKPLKRLDAFLPVFTGLKPGVNEKQDCQCKI
ncbi:MAG: hypothetical protein KGJ60_02950 [Verrucomicrobiota bacterium]|nr:hypothetical protein [Verrucomicrobiota bacterium]